MPKLLAIDDQHDNLITIKAVLNRMRPDYKVLTALSGKEGIEIAKKEQPDVILLDIIMPGMDGYETCNNLKLDPLTKNIPVLMLTAIKTDTASKIKGLKHGADAFFTKPIDPYELGAQVDVLLRIKNSEDQLRLDKETLMKNIDEKTKELLINEVKLRQIFNGFSVPAFIIDKNHIITHWNKGLENLTGYKAEEMIGTSDHWKLLKNKEKLLLADMVLNQFSDSDYNAHLSNKWNRSRIVPDAIEVEKVRLDSYGKDQWLFITSVLIHDEDNNIYCALETIQDITRSKINEMELLKHRKNLQALVVERTKQLEEKNIELERMNKLFIGREGRIHEMRNKVKKLEARIKELES